MSENLTEMEIKQYNMDQTQKRIFKTMIFCWIGWPLFFIAMYSTATNMTILGSLLGMLFMLGASFICILPMCRRFFSGQNLFKIDSYEVVTTYSDGSKESDHGAEAASVGLVVMIVKIFFMAVIGTILTILYLVYLFFKYLFQYLGVDPKPKFLKSAFFLYIISLVVFIFAPMIVAFFFGAMS